jgi:hypothetical protein
MTTSEQKRQAKKEANIAANPPPHPELGVFHSYGECPVCGRYGAQLRLVAENIKCLHCIYPQEGDSK